MKLKTHRRALPSLLLCSAYWALGAVSQSAHAGVSYTTPGAEYFQDFDSLPSDLATNASIQTTYVNGWQDDSTTVVGDHVGLPGWYLYHPLAPAEGGTNGHQRLRFGAGANTGSFWAFRSNATPGEMALGSIGSLTVAADGAPLYRALRLINNTGRTLTSFSVSFDGEQWRDGSSANAETQTCAYSLSALPSDWFTTAVFTEIPSLAFSSPVIAGTGSSGTAVDGNGVGRIQGIDGSVTGIAWAPGAELWLRWSDPQLAGNADDGLAIDNVHFSADGPPPTPPGPPDAKLTFGRSITQQLQLEWLGAAGYSYLFQHSLDLQDWTSVGSPAPEVIGAMTLPLPNDLLDDQRHYFRLLRASIP